MKRSTRAATRRLRLGVVLVCLAAVVTFLVAALQPPALRVFARRAPAATDVESGARAEVAGRTVVETCRVPDARAAKTHGAGPVAALAPSALSGVDHFARGPTQASAPAGTRLPDTKTQAELMVFLN